MTRARPGHSLHRPAAGARPSDKGALPRAASPHIVSCMYVHMPHAQSATILHVRAHATCAVIKHHQQRPQITIHAVSRCRITGGFVSRHMACTHAMHGCHCNNDSQGYGTRAFLQPCHKRGSKRPWAWHSPLIYQRTASIKPPGCIKNGWQYFHLAIPLSTRHAQNVILLTHLAGNYQVGCWFLAGSRAFIA